MNESKTKLRYWLAFMLDDMPVGEVFEPGRLHITVIPWFVTEMAESEVIQRFNADFKDRNRFEVHIGGKAMFGPKKDVEVSLIEPNQQLLNLHQKALAWFDEINARWAVKTPHVGDDYIAHIRRRRKDSVINDGDVREFNSLCLIKANRREDGKRIVAAKVEFDGF